MSDGVDDGVLGDLVEDHPFDVQAALLLFQPQGRQEVPGDGLPFPVGVSCEEKRIGGFQLFPDGVEMSLAFGEHGIFREEIMLDVHRSLFAGEGPDMAVGGEYPVIRAEEFLDGLGLGR